MLDRQNPLHRAIAVPIAAQIGSLSSIRSFDLADGCKELDKMAETGGGNRQ